MRSAFIDVNVILDVLLGRKDFVLPAAEIFRLKEDGKIELFTSALACANIAYFLKKFGKDPFAGIKELLFFVDVVDINQKTFQQALTSGFKDFEDALHYFSALEVKGLDAIITRDKRGFKGSKISVLTPKEFLELVKR